MPALWTSTPCEARPRVRRSAIQELDSRVSWPITTLTASPTGAFLPRSRPSAVPIRKTDSRVSGNSPATPRMPSVPKSWRCWAVIEVVIELSSSRVGRGDGPFLGPLHDNRHLHRSGVDDLHERIGKVHMGHEDAAVHGAAGVDGIGERFFERVHVTLGPG